LDKRERIVDAAIQLFARDGFSRVTLREVSAHAGCWLGSVSHFFPEKEQLLNAAVVEASRRCQADILSAIGEGPTPELRLRRFCRLVIESYIDGRAHFVLIDRANTDTPSEEFPMLIQEHFDQTHAALAEIVDHVASARDKTPLRWMVSYLVGLVYGAGKLHKQHLILLRLDNPAELERFLERLVAFAFAALETMR
jgi:AcrR family transcriptional regulator